MAERRMFTKKVTDDDKFMRLSASAQALYLHLMMSADDDGFCNQVNLSMFKAHASVQDLEALLTERYLYQFGSGVIVIMHWRMANALRKDRYTPTIFREELAQLGITESGEYVRLPNGCQMVATDKDSIGKDSIGKDSTEYIPPSKSAKPAKHKYGIYDNVLLTDEEHERLVSEYGADLTERAIDYLSGYIIEKGYKSKSHNLSIRRWVIEAVSKQSNANGKADVIDWDNV